jgi:hypothetical protein
MTMKERLGASLLPLSCHYPEPFSGADHLIFEGGGRKISKKILMIFFFPLGLRSIQSRKKISCKKERLKNSYMPKSTDVPS